MSEAATVSKAPTPPRPSVLTRVAAVLVVLALAGLAAYTIFSPPTTVPVSGPQATPAQTAPPPGEGEQETGGGERGD